MNPKEKYLKQYSEAEVQQLSQLPAFQCNRCVIVPARNEAPETLKRFVAQFTGSDNNVLLILVINRPAIQSDNQENRALARACRTLFHDAIWENANLSLHNNQNLYLLMVDRYTDTPIPEKQGVGLARKIAADLACALAQKQKLTSQWVYSTDADAQLPDNYFLADAVDSKRYSAQIFNFQHIPANASTSCWQATQYYQKALNYYRDALAWSGSPYAFHTLGSTLAFSIEYYCQARGFPKRAGGEDFYLLNKLAKLGAINFNHTIKVNIEARESDRVPFGTGPAVSKIMQMENPEKDYRYYNIEIFGLLRNLLASLESFWHKLQLNIDPLSELAFPTAEALRALKVDVFFSHAVNQCKNLEAFKKQFHQWFDGFITLKFIHYLQAHGYPPQPIVDAISQLQLRQNQYV